MAAKTGMIIAANLVDIANIQQVNKLDHSGIDVILTTCMYAIIGAIALHRGGAVANEVAREKILKPLGVS